MWSLDWGPEDREKNEADEGTNQKQAFLVQALSWHSALTILRQPVKPIARTCLLDDYRIRNVCY